MGFVKTELEGVLVFEPKVFQMIGDTFLKATTKRFLKRLG
jgi:hypothetical protein